MKSTLDAPPDTNQSQHGQSGVSLNTVYVIAVYLTILFALFCWPAAGHSGFMLWVVSIGTAVAIVIILLPNPNPSVMLRQAATMIGGVTFFIGLIHNINVHGLITPIQFRFTYLQGMPQALTLGLWLFVGITMAVVGLLLLVIGKELPHSEVACKVALAIAFFYLMVGLVGLLRIPPFNREWGPICLSFGLLLLAALIRAFPRSAQS